MPPSVEERVCHLTAYPKRKFEKNEGRFETPILPHSAHGSDGPGGFRLTDETYTLPPISISRREAFSFALARKLLAHYEGTPLHLDMRSVLDKIAESLQGDITIEPDWLSEHVGVLPEDRVRIDPEVWAQLVGCVERREAIRAMYQTFDGRVSGYELHPYHLLAYHGNWYALALNTAKARVETFARQAFGIVGGEDPIKVISRSSWRSWRLGGSMNWSAGQVASKSTGTLGRSVDDEKQTDRRPGGVGTGDAAPGRSRVFCQQAGRRWE